MLKEIYKECQNADFMGILRHNAKRYKTSQNRLTSTQRDNFLQENVYKKPRKINVSGVLFLPENTFLS